MITMKDINFLIKVACHSNIKPEDIKTIIESRLEESAVIDELWVERRSLCCEATMEKDKCNNCGKKE